MNIKFHFLQEVFEADASVFENRTASVVLSAERIGSAKNHAAYDAKTEEENGSYYSGFPKETLENNFNFFLGF